MRIQRTVTRVDKSGWSTICFISAQRDHSHILIHNQSVKLSTDLSTLVRTNNIPEGMETLWHVIFENGWRLGYDPELCVQYRVFVTIDKMAAMFAIFRGVKTVYLGRSGQIRECRRVC
jgi:hypothetical protein